MKIGLLILISVLTTGTLLAQENQAAPAEPAVTEAPATGQPADSRTEADTRSERQAAAPAQTQTPEAQPAQPAPAPAKPRAQAQTEDALVLFRQGNYDRAVRVCLAELESTSRTRTQKLDSYVVLCWSLFKANRYRDAVRYAQEGLKLNTNDARLIFTMSEAYFSLKDYRNALDSLERYVRVAPTGDKLQQVYNYMGEIFLEWGENNHAATAFATAVNIDPNVSALWSNLGQAKEKIKDIKGAKEAYRRALNLQSYNEQAKAGMARLEKAGAGR